MKTSLSSSVDRDGTALAAAIRAGETTAVKSLEAALARSGEVSQLGAVRARADDLAFEAARALDRTLAEGNLKRDMTFAGVPFLMKDLGVSVRGLPTVCGSLAMARRIKPADSDDFLTARFRKAGLVIFGMTTAPEFGGTLVCEPAIGPICRNPLDVRRSPGGSSGGAACAVTSGIIPVAHANDAVGSIRVPAACCGLVGLKPSRGSMPTGPGFENDCAGIVSNFVVSRTLRDTVAIFLAIKEPTFEFSIRSLPELDNQPDETLRIAVVSDLLQGIAFDSARQQAVRNAADVLRRAGHKILPFGPERLMPLVEMSSKAASSILCANLARTLDGLSPRLELGELEPMTEVDLAYGRSLSGAGIIEATIEMAKVSLTLAELWSEIDVFLTPMLSGPPPMLGAFPMNHRDGKLHGRRLFEFAPFAGFPNVAGVPALTIPHGFDGDGLPCPIQLIAPRGRDALLLKLARALENAEPWQGREISAAHQFA